MKFAKNIFIHLLLYSNFQILLSQKQSSYIVEKLPFCSFEYDEFSPAFYNEGIIFCANYKKSFWYAFTDTSEYPQLLYDLYYSKSNKNGKKWNSPVPIEDLNTNFQEGPVCLYDNDSKIAFTRNLKTRKGMGNYLKTGNRLGIFFAELSGKKWVNVVPFDFNSEDYDIMHPSISIDGTSLYFTSNKPGGYGGYDIYVSKKVNGRWTEPVNLGPKINTKKDEAFPFIHTSGRLYFASKGWNTRGGFDIYYTQNFKGEWLTPQNMREPINSTADDFGLIIDEYLQSGFFSSSRNKNDDIFTLKNIITGFDNCTKQKENTYCYIFYEYGTSEDDIQGTMKYEWDFGDGTKVRAIQAEHCYARRGKYIVRLNVIDTLTNEVMLNQAEYELDVTDYEQPYISAPDQVLIGETISIDAKKTNLKNLKIANYYWDFDDGTKALGISTNHVFYEEGIYDIKLMIESQPTRTGIKKICVYKTIIVSSN